MSQLDFILPNWEMPTNVRAVATTRKGGVSQGSYRGFNLGAHVGDDPAAVEGNRRLLGGRLGLPAEPAWLEQVHGNEVVLLEASPDVPPRADAAITRTPGIPLAILTADCLPVLFCDESGREIAAAHAGWRGLAAGILQNTVAMFDADPGDIHAWLGPAIGPEDFEVGEDVLQTFASRLEGSEAAFKPNGEDNDGNMKYLADLYQLARLALAGVGVTSVRGGGWSTYGEEGRFFSFRRDGKTGRQASLIWLVSE